MAARRTVSVALEVKAAEARKQIRGTADDAEKLEHSAKGAGDGLDKMSEKASKAGRATEKAAAKTKVAKVEAEAYKRELGSLDKQIDATVLRLKVLGREFSATGDKTVLARFNAERRMLSQLRAIEKSAENDGAGMVEALKGLPSQLGITPVIGGIAAAAAAAAPLIGSAIAGAVVGGVGIGGIAGGIYAAAQDQRVGAALSHFTDTFMAEFASAGTPFIQPLIRAFGDLEETSGFFVATLHRGFADLAPVFGPLVKGVRGLVDQLGPGLERTFEAARPAIRALGRELPEIGDALSDMLRTITSGDRATEGLIALLHATEELIRVTGDFIGYLEFEFDWLVKIGGALDQWKEKSIGNAILMGFSLDYLTDAATNVTESFDSAKDSSQDWDTSLHDLRDTTEEVASQLANFNDEIEKYLGKTLGVEEAQIRLKKQWADTVETLKDGKRTLDINTKAGQDNKQALIDMIKAADDVRVAEYNKTGSLDAANAAYDRQIEKLRTTAEKLGFNKTQVDKLIDSVKTANAVGGLTVPVTMPGLNTYINRLAYFIQQLGIAKGLAAAEFATYRAGERNPSANRWGGVYEHAAVGTLREASYYSAASPGRYMIAEPSTRGEAFVPKSGDYGRSMSILNRAAGWYGASVVPGGYGVRAGGSTQTVVHEHRHVLVVEGTGVMSGLRREVELLGGDVQSALGSRIRVGG